jgi:two-component system chemotaxis sensor kinase CheA
MELDLNDEEFAAQLRAVFEEEAREGLLVLNQLLCEAEQSGLDRPDIDKLYRTAHNLKGAAAAVQLDTVVVVLHDLETSFGAWRDGSVQPGVEVFDSFFCALDTINHLLAGGDAADNGAVPAPAVAEPVAVPPVPQPVATLALPTATPTVAGAAPLPAAKPVGPAAAPKEAGKDPAKETDGSIRIPLETLNDLMAEIGEILLVKIKSEQRLAQTRLLRERLGHHQRRFGQAADDIRRFLRADGSRYRRLAEYLQDTGRWIRDLEAALSVLEQASSRDHTALSILSTNLQEDIKQVRLQPISTLFDLMPRVVRDTARVCQRHVQVEISGEDTRLDKKVVEALKDPLVHMVRNAVDHGIEPPEVRAQSGKPATGRIRITAAQVGSQIHLTVADDGGGIDPDKVVAKMVTQGLWTPHQAKGMTKAEILQAILTPGFSTAAAVTEISGRGVGMDVVATRIRNLRGELTIHSQIGKGTEMRVKLPLSMVTTQGLLLQAEGQTYAIPVSAVERLVRVKQSDVRHLQDRRVIILDEVPLSCVALRELLPLPTWTQVADARTDEWLRLVILNVENRRLALAVDDLVGEQEMISKPLGFPLSQVPFISGATLDGAGRVMLILNPLELASATTRVVAAVPETPPAAGAEPDVILVVDDSPSIQKLEREILEGAGFTVQVANDGLEAWQVLQSSRCAMMFLDLDMPRMNGFELLERLRTDTALRDLPVVVVSSRQDAFSIDRVKQLGAVDYVSKEHLDRQRFLRLVAMNL